MKRMFVLQWNDKNEGFPEVETFDTLQQALIRLQQLAYETQSNEFVGEILCDTQDQDGQLHDVAEFSVMEGFTFSTEELPSFVE